MNPDAFFHAIEHRQAESMTFLRLHYGIDVRPIAPEDAAQATKAHSRSRRSLALRPDGHCHTCGKALSGVKQLYCADCMRLRNNERILRQQAEAYQDRSERFYDTCACGQPKAKRSKTCRKRTNGHNLVLLDHDRLGQLVVRDGRSIRAIERDSGLGDGTLHKILGRRANTRLDVAERICSTLGVSLFDVMQT